MKTKMESDNKVVSETKKNTAYFHLPGLFEFYELYRVFLPLYREHREYFYDWCEIGSIYGAPSDCIWGGGRTSFGNQNPMDVLKLTQQYDMIPCNYMLKPHERKNNE